MSGDLRYKASLDTGDFLSGMRGIQAAAQAVRSGILGAAAPFLSLTAAFLGVKKGADLVGKSIGEAASNEQMRTAFMPLLGSAAAAKARMEELANFAAETPFELPEVAQASKVLETLTRGAMSTGAGLTLVGDLASATNTPFEATATTVGRLYDALQSGRPMGEMGMRLQEMGAISGETVAKLQAMQQSGARGTEIWKVAEQALQRFSGGMKLQSQTWNGLLSTLSDNVNGAFREFGEPLINALKPGIQWLIESTKNLAGDAKKFGELLVAGFGAIRDTISEGGIGELLGGALQMGFAKAINFLLSHLRGVSAFLLSMIQGLPEQMMATFGMLTNPNFWQGLRHILASVGAGFIAVIAGGLAPIVNKLLELLNKIPGIHIDWRADDLAKASKDAAASEGALGAGMMKSAMSPAIQTRVDGGKAAIAAYAQAFNDAPKLLDDAMPSVMAGFAEKVREKLSALRNEATAADGQEGKKDGTAFGPAATAAKEKLSDNYSKIGLFVGGANPAITEAKKTNTLIGSLINSTRDGNNRLVSAIADRLMDQSTAWA